MSPLVLDDGAAAATPMLKTRPSPAPTPHSLKLSEKGLEMIAHFEGYRATAYNDAAQPPNATIGVGHMLHRGPCTDADHKLNWTRAYALHILAGDAAAAELAIKQRVHVHLTQPQFDALCSFTFNVGIGWLYGSTLLTHLNNGNYNAIPGDLAQWVHAGSTILPGLVTRRRAEGDCFAHGTYPE